MRKPHPFSSQSEAGPSHQGARFPGALSTRPVRKLPKVPREPWSFPIWSWRRRRARCRWPGGAEPGGARARRLHAPLPGERLLSPPPLSGGPRPRLAPPGTPRLLLASWGRSSRPSASSGPPSTSPSPGASPLILGLRHARNPRTGGETDPDSSEGSDCLM